jgi:hypothetical protein
MLKISATQLESYRRLIDGTLSPEQFERQLLRLDPPNAMMEKGTAFHEMLQTDDPMQFEGIFTSDCITKARSKMDYRSKVFEYKVRRQYRTKYGDISVTGVADQLLGLDVVEIKTKYSPISYDSYADSMQWRVYCELFGAKFVTYKVYEFADVEADDFKNYQEFTFVRPAYNDEKVFNMIHYLHEYIMIRGLHEEPALQMNRINAVATA